MAAAKGKVDMWVCFSCVVVGALGATLYFMWSDVKNLWSP